MTKRNEHLGTPPIKESQIHRHSSDVVRSRNDAGGLVPESDYAGKSAAQKRDERQGGA
jgi:hypothetical protein